MELWNRFTMTHFSLRLHYRWMIQTWIAILACNVLVPSPNVLAEIYGSGLKKFVWTTVWPMEENYVTYKLLGPINEKCSTQTFTSPCPLQRTGLEGKIQSCTRSIEREKRIKTEIGLDELPGKCEAFNNGNQLPHIMISFISPNSFDNSSLRNINFNNDPLRQREVFSARKAKGYICDPKAHTMQLVSKVIKGSYGRRTAKFQPSKYVCNLQENILDMPELVSKTKSVNYPEILYETEGFPFESSNQKDTPAEWGILEQQQRVVKNINSIPIKRKSKFQDQPTAMISADTGILTSLDELLPSKNHPYSKTIAIPDSLAQSNIQKIVSIKAESMHAPITVSENTQDVDSHSSAFGKVRGRVPPLHCSNNSTSNFSSYNHNINFFKGSSVSLNGGNKMMNFDKKINAQSKSGHLDEVTELFKSSDKNNVHRKPVDKREKFPSNSERNPIKKRRENSNVTKGPTAQRSPGAMQQKKRRRVSFRYKTNNSKPNGITSEHNSSSQ